MLLLRDGLICALLIVFAVECVPQRKRDALVCGSYAHWDIDLSKCVCNEGCGGSVETGCIPPTNEENNGDDGSSIESVSSDSEGDGSSDSEGDGSSDSEGDGSSDSEGDGSNSSEGDSSSSSGGDGSSDSEGDGSSDSEGDGSNNSDSEGDGSNSSEGDVSNKNKGKGIKCGIRAYRKGDKCVCDSGCFGDPYVECFD